MKQLGYYSGKIEFNKEGCFVGGQKVDCPQPPASRVTQAGDKLDVLPRINSLDKRSDLVFTSIFLTVILSFCLLAIFKIRIFGKTPGEYIKPIWYFIPVCILIVFWQYLFGLKINDNFTSIRISQWVWEVMVLVSAYKLSKISGFSYGNMFFLGVIYSIIIHGLKIAIRYYFYNKTLLYTLDRFLYGSLLVMMIVFIGGSMFLFFRRKGILKF